MMDRTEFFKRIENNDIAPVYLFKGTEEYEKKRALSSLRRKLLPEGLEGLNETVLEAVPVQQILECALEIPMMSDKRIVTVRNHPLLRSKAEKPDGMKEISAYLDTPVDTTVLIFYQNGEMPEGTFLKSAQKHRNVTIVDFSPLVDVKEAEEKLAEVLAPYRKRMAPDAVRKLTEMCGMELGILVSEAEKLVDYTGKRGTITSDDVEKAVTHSAEYSVFTIMDKLLQGNGDEAFKMLDDVIGRSGDSNDAWIRLLAVFERQLSNLQRIEKARERGESKPETISKLKIRPFLYDIWYKQLQLLNSGAAERLYLQATDGEYKVKSGQARPEQVMESLMLLIAAMRKNDKGKNDGKNGASRKR